MATAGLPSRSAACERTVSVPPPGIAAGLWAPVGLRYHALHHLLPSLPYHSLGEAHRRLSAHLGAGSTYARASGTGSLVAPGIPMSQLAISAAISLLSALVLMGFAGVVAAIIGWLAALLFLLRFERRIGGYTGDCLGAMEQCGEIAIFLTIAAIVSG